MFKNRKCLRHIATSLVFILCFGFAQPLFAQENCIDTTVTNYTYQGETTEGKPIFDPTQFDLDHAETDQALYADAEEAIQKLKSCISAGLQDPKAAARAKKLNRLAAAGGIATAVSIYYWYLRIHRSDIRLAKKYLLEMRKYRDLLPDKEWDLEFARQEKKVKALAKKLGNPGDLNAVRKAAIKTLKDNRGNWIKGVRERMVSPLKTGRLILSVLLTAGAAFLTIYALSEIYQKKGGQLVKITLPNGKTKMVDDRYMVFNNSRDTARWTEITPFKSDDVLSGIEQGACAGKSTHCLKCTTYNMLKVQGYDALNCVEDNTGPTRAEVEAFVNAEDSPCVDVSADAVEE